MTSIRTHDLAGTAPPELPPLPIAALMIGVYNLLQDGADLPQPCYITVSETSRQIDLQFPASITAFRPLPGGRAASGIRKALTSRTPSISTRPMMEFQNPTASHGVVRLNRPSSTRSPAPRPPADSVSTAKTSSAAIETVTSASSRCRFDTMASTVGHHEGTTLCGLAELPVIAADHLTGIGRDSGAKLGAVPVRTDIAQEAHHDRAAETGARIDPHIVRQPRDRAEAVAGAAGCRVTVVHAATDVGHAAAAGIEDIRQCLTGLYPHYLPIVHGGGGGVDRCNFRQRQG